MIHVAPKPEPDDFDAKVRKPGRLFLQNRPHPKGRDWNNHAYWSSCSEQLYAAYDGVCAYTGEWFSLSSLSPSVDHFYPKSKYHELAYEWSNYRLTTQKMNSYKGDKIIIDPFKIKNGDLMIDFPSCQVKPRSDMETVEKTMAAETINILHLNDDPMVINRYDIIVNYINGYISKVFLERRYPFIASELNRQNLYDTIGERFKSLPPKTS